MGEWHGKQHYIPAERLYAYEHNSPYRVSDHTREKLMMEIDEDEYYPSPIPGRISLNIFEDFFKSRRIDLSKEEDCEHLRSQFTCNNSRGEEILEDLIAFCRVDPKFPDQDSSKNYATRPVIELKPEMTREEMISYLADLRDQQPIADLAFYAFRDMTRCDWQPFLKAAMERNPVSIDGAKSLSDEDVIEMLMGITNESIYDGPRLAQPDEVWNYRRGDGVERAICLANIWHARHPEAPITLTCSGDQATLTCGSTSWTFPSAKGLNWQGPLHSL
jgi:hypothetical protein